MKASFTVARHLLRDATKASLRGGSASFGSGSATAGAGSAGRSLVSRQAQHLSCLHGSFQHFSTVAQVDVDSAKQVAEASEMDAPSSAAKSEDTHKPRQKISMVKISEVLKRKHTVRWVEPVISKDASVREAITLCIERKLNGMMVVDRSENRQTTTEMKTKCVGMITSRDILRMMSDSIKEGKTSEEVLNEPISEQMTPINQVIYGRPHETIGQCRAIMGKLGIKCLPILSGGRVEGILTARDMSDFYIDPEDRGGKKNYLRDVSDRSGLNENTSMAEPPVFVMQHLALRHAPLYMNVGVAEYPHPYKTEGGIGSSRRSELLLC